MKDIYCEMMITFHPTLACSFSCAYCARHKKSLPEAVNIEKIMYALEKFQKKFLVIISGGEPFLIPNFTEFVSALTKRHYVRIDTNLSLAEPCKKFIDCINPERIQEISFSTHVLEWERGNRNIKELVGRVKEFQQAGFQMVGNYVAYPPLLARLEKDLEFFRSQAITVLPTLFIGTFKGKVYPLDHGRPSYSLKELELIRRFNPNACLPLTSPRGKFCQAGSAALWVNDRLEVFPCLEIQNNKLGNFGGCWEVFPKVIRCPLNFCVDRYNSTFNCTFDNKTLKYILQKAISEKGTASDRESFWALRKHWLLRPLEIIKTLLA